MAKKKEKKSRNGSIAWSGEELRLMWALRAAGQKGSEVVKLLNKYYVRTGKTARTEKSVLNTFSKHKEVQNTLTATDHELAQTLINGGAGAKPAASTAEGEVKPKRKYTRKNVLQASDQPLSPAAQRALESKLALNATSRRFKLETPDASIEVMVSGKGAEAIFKKIVSAITILGK